MSSANNAGVVQAAKTGSLLDCIQCDYKLASKLPQYFIALTCVYFFIRILLSHFLQLLSGYIVFLVWMLIYHYYVGWNRYYTCYKGGYSVLLPYCHSDLCIAVATHVHSTERIFFIVALFHCGCSLNVWYDRLETEKAKTSAETHFAFTPGNTLNNRWLNLPCVISMYPVQIDILLKK